MDFSLKAVFGMDATGLKTELKSIRRDVEEFASKWAAIGWAAATTAFVALAKGAVDLAGSLVDTSQNLGINVVALQALEAQHKRNGVSQEQLLTALEKTKSAVIDAANGDAKAAAALDKLGLSARTLIGLPLEQQYEAIAAGAAKAANQNEAFNAVSDIFGSKVGPKLMGSLRELADQGLPAVMKSAQAAGHIMSQETVAALDRAGDAIDDFKKRATIAVGQIIVNFQTEEGLKVLGYRLLEVATGFGGKLLDVLVQLQQLQWAAWSGLFTGVANLFRDKMIDALAVVATQLNRILPDKFQINVAGLEQLKSSGEYVSASIYRAIAETKPTKFSEEFSSYYKKLADEAQVAANAVQRGGEASASAVSRAAKAMETAGSVAGARVAAGGEAAGQSLRAGAVAAATVLDSAADNARAAHRAGADYVADKLGKTSEENSERGRKIAQIQQQAAEDSAAVLEKAIEGSTGEQRDAAIWSAKTFGQSANELWNIAVDASAEIAKAMMAVDRGFQRIAHTGTPYEGQTTDALTGVAGRLQRQIADLEMARTRRMSPENPNGGSFEQLYLEDQLRYVQHELSLRQSVQITAARGGESLARQTYGDDVADRGLRDLQDVTTQQAASIRSIDTRLGKLLGGG